MMKVDQMQKSLNEKEETVEKLRNINRWQSDELTHYESTNEELKKRLRDIDEQTKQELHSIQTKLSSFPSLVQDLVKKGAHFVEIDKKDLRDEFEDEKGNCHCLSCDGDAPHPSNLP